MKSKLLPKLVIFSVLVILVSLPIVTAEMSSASYKLISSSLQGGGAGGGVSTSSGFRLEGSFGGIVAVSSSSSSYKVCSGFICSGLGLLYRLFLPIIVRQ